MFRDIDGRWNGADTLFDAPACAHYHERWTRQTVLIQVPGIPEGAPGVPERFPCSMGGEPDRRSRDRLGIPGMSGDQKRECRGCRSFEAAEGGAE